MTETRKELMQQINEIAGKEYNWGNMRALYLKRIRDILVELCAKKDDHIIRLMDELKKRKNV